MKNMTKGQVERTDPRVSPHGRDGVNLLLQAFMYAGQLHRDVWEFAVEIPCLRKAGLTYSDLRWLICAGLAEAGREVSLPGDPRDFRRDKTLVISDKTCLVLTDAGANFARGLIGDQSASEGPGEFSGFLLSAPVAVYYPHHEAKVNESAQSNIPKWDSHRQELRWGGLLVKQYKLPSVNQQTILTVFEEEGWPTRIDDPLTPHPDADPKRRLNDTIKSLNRNQKNRCINFMGDGSGCGVRWEPIVDGFHK